jgi:hypothetical protein
MSLFFHVLTQADSFRLLTDDVVRVCKELKVSHDWCRAAEESLNGTY